jgi:pyruvate dehydrogenase E2 component (dihydrolipoamide acetyltransferase)
MAIPVIMPKQGQSVETCIITSWLKKKGEAIQIGDILFSYETDKASFDVESTVDGILLEVFFEDGAEVPVLVNVAVIGSEGEETAIYRPGNVPVKSSSDAFQPQEKHISATAVTVAETSYENNGKIRISPRAKHLADSKGLVYSNLTGSGPNGRIIVQDIEAVLSGKVTASVASSLKPVAGFTELPLSNVRKMIAKAMHASLQNSAQLT